MSHSTNKEPRERTHEHPPKLFLGDHPLLGPDLRLGGLHPVPLLPRNPNRLSLGLVLPLLLQPHPLHLPDVLLPQLLHLLRVLPSQPRQLRLGLLRVRRRLPAPDVRARGQELVVLRRLPVATGGGGGGGAEAAEGIDGGGGGRAVDGALRGHRIEE